MKNRIKLESDISNKIYIDNKNTVHFEYKVNIDNGNITLLIHTYNRNTEQSFLLVKCSGKTSLECLEYAYNHIIGKVQLHSYTVTWRNTNGITNISYFQASNIEEVRSKILHHNDNIAILDIALNPIS